MTMEAMLNGAAAIVAVAGSPFDIANDTGWPGYRFRNSKILLTRSKKLLPLT